MSAHVSSTQGLPTGAPPKHALVMDEPVAHSLLDGAQDVIGKPLSRIEGAKKTTGSATYAAEHAIDGLTYGFLVEATSVGAVKHIEAAAARAMPGVVAVVTALEALIPFPQHGLKNSAPPRGVGEVRYIRQPVAVVVAESFEQARAAAEAVRVEVAPKPGAYDFAARLGDAYRPADTGYEAFTEQGDLDAALATADVTLDVVYTTPSQMAAAMEPQTSIAVWSDEGLTLYGSYQMLASNRAQLADALGLEPEQVRIVSPYVGGGFGSKLGINPESVAAAVAAKAVGRPVKVAMTRQQVFDATSRRSNTRQHIRLGADRTGRLVALAHESVCSNLPGNGFFEPSGVATHFLYRGAARRVSHEIVPLNVMLASAVRAPGEGSGMLALECAMDELAEAAGVDPVVLRKINEPERDPEKDVPFSARNLAACLDAGAARFGWEERNRVPGSRREGEWLIGHGMAAATRSNKLQPAEARVRLGPQGVAVVETDMTDIGTGTYTILAQIAGEVLGLPLDRVDVRLGDTRFPAAAGSGGSFGAASSGSSVYLACEALREQIAGRLECAPDEMTMKDGFVIANNRRVELTTLVGDGLEAIGRIEPGRQNKATNQAAYGAHFCEVRVNAVTGETRVSRWVGVFAAGRILNEKTARSQCLGGIVFGIGAALTEELVLDARDGKVVNRDFGEYHVPVNADVPQLDVVFIEERDPAGNPLQAKGIGELGISGAGAAIANAVYNATGIRVRDYPVTLDKLIAGLPAV